MAQQLKALAAKFEGLSSTLEPTWSRELSLDSCPLCSTYMNTHTHTINLKKNMEGPGCGLLCRLLAQHA